MGTTASADSSSSAVACHLAVDHELSQSLTRFWETEEVSSERQLSPDERSCVQHFHETHRRNKEGRYVVRLLFLQPPQVIGSREIALACFNRLERRLTRDASLAINYDHFMCEYSCLNHMEAIPPSCDIVDTCIYLPHHPVIKKDDSKKIRVVFNASQRGSNGFSLNSYLHVGPKLQEDILAIISRWSFSQVVFSCDIVKMFRQFRVDLANANWQRIFWRNDPADSLQSFRLTTVTYGTACAPFLANACMLQLANDEETRFSEAADIIRHNRYADDLFAGGDDLPEALTRRNQLIEILASAGMEVGKWSANDVNLLHPLGPHDDHAADTTLELEDSVSTLGLKWIPSEDTFYFTVADHEVSGTITKRSIRAEIARLFDPIGWLSPIIVQGKLMLQNLWMLGIDWDSPVSPHLEQEWLTFRKNLPDIQSIRIPRWTGTTRSSTWQLHGFCDASERAFAAAVYIICLSDAGRRCKLLTAKSNVAPVKVISIPKLELCGADLLAKLIAYLLPKLPTQPSRIICWSDLKVVLAWLSAHPSRWKPFFANRVSNITSSLPTAEWKYVPTKDNPADIALRGTTPGQLHGSTI